VRRLGWALATGALATGCATASPFLAPARVLRPNKLELDVGTAYHAPVASSALTDAQASTATEAARLRASAVYGVTPPGVVPYVAGRTGIGQRSEGSLALIGRVVRIGVRREFVRRGDFSFTAGVNGRLAFVAGAQDAAVPRAAITESRLYGGELTAMVGTNRQDIYHLWAGVRVGYLWGDSTLVLGGATGMQDVYAFSSHRLEGAAVLGLRVGFGRVAVSAEIDLSYAWATASALPAGGLVTRETGSATGFALIPAGALSYRF